MQIGYSFFRLVSFFLRWLADGLLIRIVDDHFELNESENFLSESWINTLLKFIHKVETDVLT